MEKWLKLRPDNPKPWIDYLFCVLVGSLYIFSVSRTILTSTLIIMNPVNLYFIGLTAIVFFLVVFYSRVTKLATLAILLLGGLFVFFTLEDVEAQYPHLYDMWQMIQGYLFTQELGRTVIWIVCFMLGFIVVVFMLYYFSFFLLAGGGIIIFLFSWVPGFTRDETSFFLFLVCFCLLLIRRMNRVTSVVLLAAPLFAGLVLATHLAMPTYSDLYVRRTLDDVRRPLFLEDRLFEFFNPMYFSFQSTGFAGAGGRLGGPVTLNNRPVMTVDSPGRVYLIGAISDTYTGHSWVQSLEDDAIYTHGLTPGHFEMLETTAALIRQASVINGWIHSLDDILPTREHNQIRNFRTLRVADPIRPFHLNTYFPVDTLSINIGDQRTGTIFRPARAFDIDFTNPAQDYLPQSTISPIGDMRAPGFMSRHTSYDIQFLNVDTNLSFVQEMLRQSQEGLYAARHAETSVFSLGNQEFTSIDVFVSDILNFIEEHLSYYGIWGDDGYSNDWETDREILEQQMWEIIADGGIPSVFQREGDLSFGVMSIAHDANWHLSGWHIIMDDVQDFSVEAMMRLFNYYNHEISPDQWLEMMSDGVVTEVPFSIAPGEDLILAWLDDFSNNILANYAAQVRQNFMDVPEIVPQRVYDLTMEIIDEYDNDFDRIMAIREYLLHIPYTLQTTPVPRNMCFVDHFLFEGRQGYCTYFASAMAIMSRIAGVPSRYVEGFVLPPVWGEDTTISVTNSMAHAWVEVYLEGFGWLIVESTPPYAALAHMIAPPPQFTGGAGGVWDPMEFFDEYEWLQMMMGPWMHPGGETTFAAGEFTGINQPGEAPTATLTLQEMQMLVLGVLVLVALLVLARSAGQYWHVRSGLKKIKVLTRDEQTIAYFNGILDIVEYYTKPLKSGETPKAYGTHMGKRFAFKSDSVFFKDLIDLYYKARYSGIDVTETEAAIMEEAYHDMVNMLRLMRWRPQFLYLRYVKRIGVV